MISKLIRTFLVISISWCLDLEHQSAWKFGIWWGHVFYYLVPKWKLCLISIELPIYPNFGHLLVLCCFGLTSFICLSDLHAHPLLWAFKVLEFVLTLRTCFSFLNFTSSLLCRRILCHLVVVQSPHPRLFQKWISVVVAAFWRVFYLFTLQAHSLSFW